MPLRNWEKFLLFFTVLLLHNRHTKGFLSKETLNTHKIGYIFTIAHCHSHSYFTVWIAVTSPITLYLTMLPNGALQSKEYIYNSYRICLWLSWAENFLCLYLMFDMVLIKKFKMVFKQFGLFWINTVLITCALVSFSSVNHLQGMCGCPNSALSPDFMVP